MDEDILLRLDEIERKLRDYPLLSSMQPMAHTIPIADANGKLNDWIDGDKLANVLVIKYIWEWNGTIHTHQNDLQGGQIDHGLALYGLEDDDHPQYASAEGSGTRRAYEAGRLNKSVNAGAGLTGGGLLTSDISLSVDTAYSFSWTGTHTFSQKAIFNGNLSTERIYPVTDGQYALQVRGNNEAVLVNFDTENMRVGVNKTGATYTLDVSGIGNFETAVQTPKIQTASGTSLTVQPTDHILLDPQGGTVRLMSNCHIQADNYASQTTGWRITYDGQGDFRYLFSDELHTKQFFADLEQALAGGQIVCKSVAVLAQDFTLPAAGANADFYVKDLPSAPDMAVFQANDFVGFRKFTRSGGALNVDWAWGTVTDYVDQANGTQRWTFTRHSGTPGTATGTINADALVLDFGTSGNGFYEVNAVDGLYAANSPYAQIVTWSSHPATQTIRARLGNLYGVFGIANEYGLFAGDGSATANKFIRASNNAVELHNTPLNLYDSGNATISLDPTTLSIALGSPLPTGYTTNKGFWAGKDGTTYKVRIGEPGGDQLQYDGTDLYVRADNSNYIKTSGTSIQFYSNATKMMELSATPAVLIGQVSSGQPNVYITGGAVQIRNNTTVRVELTSAGVLKLNNSSGSTVIELDASGNNRISNKLLMDGTSSALAIGATPPASSSSGTGIWLDRTGFYSLISGVKQVWISTSDGRLYFGGGNGYINSSGIIFPGVNDFSTQGMFWNTSTRITGYRKDDGTSSAMLIDCKATTNPSIVIKSYTIAEPVFAITNPSVILCSSDGSNLSTVEVYNLNINFKVPSAGNINFHIGNQSKGYIDSSSINGRILTTGYIAKDAGGTTYNGYIYVPLNPVGTNTNWYGNAKSIGSYTLYASNFGVTNYAKALALCIIARWSSQNLSAYFAIRDYANNIFYTAVRANVANAYMDGFVIVPLDSSGRFTAQVYGADTNATYIYIAGYFV
ncbi:MAG: hypothetical protein D6735_13745 [Acidobacteria bacterium]|nr:MAG: hypothetical protein D6735_13745 [Acidobacteriota bacterium]